MDIDIPDENMVGELGTVCRLCLIPDTIMESLHSPLEEIYEDDITTLFHIMEKISPTKLSNDPKYPSYLCLNCITLLNTAYKVHRLMEISQSQLSTLFKEHVQKNKSAKHSDSNVVEIISGNGKYNLKDILIIEEDSKEKSTFEGFLKNLGSEIRANFVSKSSEREKRKKDEIHIVNIIPLRNTNWEGMFNISELEKESPETQIEQSDSAENETHFKCNQCDQTFASRGNLHRHREAHESKSYLCQICGHVAKVRTSLTNHMLLKHRGKQFPCDVCGKKYLSKSHLRHHMLKHKNKREHLCTVCGKSFNYGSSLEYHMRIHTGEKKYKCTHCERAFTMRCGLNRHLRTHTGMRPYKCSFCDKAFRSKGEVDCHEMIHTGFRPYHCKLCGKGFTKTHNLKIHMLAHSGPFMCEFCQRGFTEISYLKLHMKVTHGLIDYDVNTSHILVVEEDGTDISGTIGETLIITTE